MAGCARALTGEPAIGVLGDAPYSDDEVERLDRVIDEINAQPLAFVAHVGDIGTSTPQQACGDAWLLQRKAQFGRIRHPFVLLPGDNEWADCKDSPERLRRWRAFFCKPTLPVVVQEGEYCEHMRWEFAGRVFVALNVPGRNNNIRQAEHAPRMQAVLSWLDEAAALAEKREGLVILMQANPFIALPRDGFAALRNRLEELGKRFPGRIVLIHGDTHVYKDDEPLPGLRRIEVWGSPIVAWHLVPLTARPSRSPR